MDLIIEPLLSLEDRLLSFSSRTPVAVVIDLLLRLHNAPEWRDPITLYFCGADDEGVRPQRTLSALEFLQLHSVLQRLRSEVHPTALGLTAGYFESLLLASCARGKRHLLPSAMLCVGPLEIADLPLSNAIGLGNQQGPSLLDQARVLVQAQLDHVLAGLHLSPGLWQVPRVLSAEAAISAGLADAIVPIHTPTPHNQKSRDSNAAPERYANLRQLQRNER